MVAVGDVKVQRVVSKQVGGWEQLWQHRGEIICSELEGAGNWELGAGKWWEQLEGLPAATPTQCTLCTPHPPTLT